MCVWLPARIELHTVCALNRLSLVQLLEFEMEAPIFRTQQHVSFNISFQAGNTDNPLQIRCVICWDEIVLGFHFMATDEDALWWYVLKHNASFNKPTCLIRNDRYPCIIYPLKPCASWILTKLLSGVL